MKISQRSQTPQARGKQRLLRVTTVPISLKLLLNGQFNFFQQQGFEVLTVSANGPEVSDLKAQGLNHEVVPMTRQITPFADLYALYCLIRVIRKFKPTIVHTHTPKAGLLGMLAAWICRVPVRLHTVAGLPLMETSGVKAWILGFTERITYMCAHHVYPNSTGLLEYIHSTFNMQHSKFKIIGKGSSNGIDTTYFSGTNELREQAKAIHDRYNIAHNAIVFSFVGRIVKDKGIVELTDAFQKISRELNVKLLLIGSFEEQLDPLPQETMAFLKNDSRVVLAGFQQDVRPWMLASDVFVFPSYREGFPNVVMQAACLEIPCIVSDINGCNEIIQNGETGIVIPSKDATSLYNAMLLLANDKPKGASFSKKSRAFVVKNFDQQYVWGELLREYSKHLFINSSTPNSSTSNSITSNSSTPNP